MELVRINNSQGVGTRTQITSSQRPCVSPRSSEIHVLAVDDSIIDRKVIERLLKTSSYKVTSVDSALRALEILGIEQGHTFSDANRIEFDMIITDYCMPDMIGFDLLKKVKANSILKEIPVVIMSSENIPTRIERCLEEGAKEFIIKPVQLEDVQRLAKHIMGKTKIASVMACTKRKLEVDLQSRNTSNKRAYVRKSDVIT